MRVVALLPMKAHSARVKGKNFKSFNNKPLFRWILDTLLGLPEIAQVVINTDAVTMLAGGLPDCERVELRNRKPELCGDLVSMNLIIADDIAVVPADAYLMTHVTNPLLSTETIRTCLEKFVYAHMHGQADSLFTVNRFQTRFYRADGSPVNHDPDNLVRTQDLEPWYEENSNLYIFTRESFAATGARIGKRPLMFETPRVESIDIDEQSEWIIAESLARFSSL